MAELYVGTPNGVQKLGGGNDYIEINLDVMSVEKAGGSISKSGNLDELKDAKMIYLYETTFDQGALVPQGMGYTSMYLLDSNNGTLAKSYPHQVRFMYKDSGDYTIIFNCGGTTSSNQMTIRPKIYILK